MPVRRLALLIVVLALSTSLFADKKSDRSAGAPDKILMQNIWNAWSTRDPANAAQFYDKGQHVFFDIAPLKYNSWDEYQDGVKKVLADYTDAKFTVNDDAEIHPGGEYAWGTATVKDDLTNKSGKHEMGTLRWTVIWHKEGGKWLIVHEHVSAPLQ